MFTSLFNRLCLTSLVSAAGSYPEDEPNLRLSEAKKLMEDKTNYKSKRKRKLQ